MNTNGAKNTAWLFAFQCFVLFIHLAVSCDSGHENNNFCSTAEYSLSLSTFLAKKKPQRTQTYQSADLFLSVGGRARRGLDHSGRLVVRQLLNAALAGHDVTDLRSVSNTPRRLNRDRSDGQDKPSGSIEVGKDKKIFRLTSRGR